MSQCHAQCMFTFITIYTLGKKVRDFQRRRQRITQLKQSRSFSEDISQIAASLGNDVELVVGCSSAAAGDFSPAALPPRCHVCRAQPQEDACSGIPMSAGVVVVEREGSVGRIFNNIENAVGSGQMEKMLMLRMKNYCRIYTYHLRQI